MRLFLINEAELLLPPTIILTVLTYPGGYLLRTWVSVPLNTEDKLGLRRFDGWHYLLPDFIPEVIPLRGARGLHGSSSPLRGNSDLLLQLPNC